MSSSTAPRKLIAALFTGAAIFAAALNDTEAQSGDTATGHIRRQSTIASKPNGSDALDPSTVHRSSPSDLAGNASDERLHRRYSLTQPRIGARGSEGFGDERHSMPNGVADSFLIAASQSCRRIGCSARDLLAVMMRESSLRADAWNRSSGAVGLIQFLPGSLTRLGWTGSQAEFGTLTAEEQLVWVEAFLRPYGRYGLTSAGRIYQAVFMPASLRSGAGEETALIDCRGVNADRYARNRGLDRDGDGRITVGELTQAVEQSCQTAAWLSIEARLREIDGRPGASRKRLVSETDSAELQNPAQTPRRRTAQIGVYHDVDQSPYTLQPSTRVQAPRDRESGEAPTADRTGVDLSTRDGLARALSALGYNMRRVSLASALRAYQHSAGLIADGVAGPKTRAALAAELYSTGVVATL